MPPLFVHVTFSPTLTVTSLWTNVFEDVAWTAWSAASAAPGTRSEARIAAQRARRGVVAAA
jgi:hypothetical protein